MRIYDNESPTGRDAGNVKTSLNTRKTDRRENVDGAA